ncbi:MAG: UDP-N-acetylmuramoyl-tripeptide--D-alanyl-D-alanine ligase [bacterium]
MKPLTTDDLLALGGERVAGETRPLGEVGIDSRAVAPESTFFCLRGPRFDGHDFARPAVDAGARVVVCEPASARRVSATLGGRATVIALHDTTRGLGLLAARYRLGFGGEVVGLTGSSGKTTTKELIAAVLATRGAVHKTPGNLNNHLGVPLTLLGLRPDHAFAVIEMGMSALGEIAWLADLARPRIGVITSVGEAHLESLGTIDNVARAKGELLRALPVSGVGILPSDVARALAADDGRPGAAAGGRPPLHRRRARHRGARRRPRCRRHRPRGRPEDSPQAAPER